MKIICTFIGAVLIGFVQTQISLNPSSSTPKEGVDLDSLLGDIFQSTENYLGGSSTVTPSSSGTTRTTARTTVGPTEPAVRESCPGGECVQFYLCNNDNSFITDGLGVIDIRFNEQEGNICKSYLETCCGASQKVNESLVKTPKTEGCGYRNKEGIGFRIAGSVNEAEYGEFPWMVAVVREEKLPNKKLSIYTAGGSLIHPKVVLTAAHYVYNKTPGELIIRAGEWDTQTTNEIFPHQDRSVAEIIVHEKFNKGNLHNDIALLVLHDEVDLAENIKTVCLPPQAQSFDNLFCFASGWGKDIYGKEGKYQVILKRVELPTIRNDQCQAIFRTTRLGKRFVLDKSFMCAGGEKGKDTCHGDGGSPLVCPIVGADSKPDRFYQAGIVAWGLGCGDEVPAAYANVAMFRDWIDGQMKYRNLDTSFYIPS